MLFCQGLCALCTFILMTEKQLLFPVDHFRNVISGFILKFKMAAEKLSKNIEGVWLFLRDSFDDICESASQLWSVSDWQVRVCFILSAILLLNGILIGIAWHIYGVLYHRCTAQKENRKAPFCCEQRVKKVERSRERKLIEVARKPNTYQRCASP